ncbi:MAG: PTS transporter subunit EIIC [Coprobacillus cateniformis]
MGDVHNVVYTLIGQPLNGIGNQCMDWLFDLYFIWFMLVLRNSWNCSCQNAIMPIWMAADAASLAATSAGQVAPNIITYQWINAVSSPGGAGATIGLVICILLFAKSKRYKTFGKVATIPSIVNINEPVVFGMPCMLNTLLFVPFVFLPVVLYLNCIFLNNCRNIASRIWYWSTVRNAINSQWIYLWRMANGYIPNLCNNCINTCVFSIL